MSHTRKDRNVIEPDETQSIGSNPTAHEVVADSNLIEMLSPVGYELLDEIGSGGMGVVYRARDLNLEREVAVKLLHDRYLGKSEIAARFLEETRITGQLQHPGIPSVYQGGMLAGDRPYLAMKLIRGQTLDFLIKKNAEIDRLAVFEAISQAVGYAHAHDVIHRDLKPSNVMVGRFGEVQVMDWGLAKVLTAGVEERRSADPEATIAHSEIQTQRNSDTPQTLHGTALGTPAYMSPEQAAGELDKIDARLDVFGLGAILCVLLTGEPPFTGKDAESVRIAAMRGRTEKAFARLDAAESDPGVVELCKQCLAFEAKDRPVDANSVAKEIGRLRAAADERVRQAELDRVKAEVQVREQSKRKRTVLIAAGILVTVLAFGIFGTSLGLVHARQQEKAAVKERDEKEEARQAEADARQRAEANYRLARRAVDTFLTKISEEKLLAEPHMEPLRKELLSTARDFYKQFLVEQDGASQAQLDFAQSQERYGNLLWQLGSIDEALSQVGACQAILEDLITIKSSTDEATEMLSELYRVWGQRLIVLNRWDDGLKWLRESVQLAASNLDGEGSKIRRSLLLCTAQFRLGDQLTKHRHFDEAKTELEAAQKLITQLVNDNPNNFDVLVAQGSIASSQGILASAMRDHASSEVYYEQALKIRLQILENAGRSPKTISPVGESRTNLANVYRKLDKFEDADREFSAAVELGRELVENHPAVTAYHSLLARQLTGRANVSQEQGNFEQANKLNLESIEIVRRVSLAYPQRIDLAVNLGVAEGNMGNTQLGRKEFDQAIQWYTRSIETCEAVREMQPGHNTAGRLLRNSYWGRADALVAKNQLEKSLIDFDNASKFATEGTRTEVRLSRAHVQVKLGKYSDALAEVEAQTKEPETSGLAWFDSARVLARAAEGVRSDQAVANEDRQRLASDYTKRAIVTLQQAAKLKYFDKPVGLRELRTHPDLAPIREHEGFQELLKSVSNPPPDKEK